MKKIKSAGLSLAVISTLGFVGCGSGGGSSTPTDDTQIGTFVDAPVDGLYYKTETQSGYTTLGGEYKYKNGESVIFKLGNLTLGKVKAQDIVTPYELGDSNISVPSLKTKHIATLLQSLDENSSNTNRITISNKLLGKSDQTSIIN